MIVQGKTARIHVAELQGRLTAPPAANPLTAFKVDQELSAGKTLPPSTNELLNPISVL